MDFKKIPLSDPVAVQHEPSFQVTKGCASVTNTRFSSLTSSSSSASFNIQVPSLNVFMDRKVAWTCEFVLKLVIQHDDFIGAAPNAAASPNPYALDKPIGCQIGRDIAPNSFPAHRLINTATATVNDTVSSVNMADVLNELLTLNDLRPDEEANQTCPSYMSRYARYQDGFGASNSSIGGFFDDVGYKPPNGAFADVEFVDANGNSLPAGNVTLNIDGTDFKFINGRPVIGGTPAGGGNAGVGQPEYRAYLRIRTTEYLMLSPFLFNYDRLNSTGIFGINSASLTFNFNSDPQNCIQFISRVINTANAAGGGASLTSIAYHTLPGTGSPFLRNDLNIMFCSPSVDMKLPARSVVPYTNFPRYFTSDAAGFGAAVDQITIRSNTITLPSVPDVLIIAVKKSAYTYLENEHYFPISKLNITFDNYSALSSSFTREQLYQMSYRNGLHYDYNTWRGTANTPRGLVQTVGGFIVLRLGIDIPLPPGQASGVSGNYALQIEATVEKPRALRGAAVPNLRMLTITPQSGFFVTENGQSQIVLNPLKEEDVLSTSTSDSMSVGDYESLTYGGGFFDGLANSAIRYGQMLAPHLKKAGKDAIDFAEGVVTNPAVQQAALRIGEKALTKKMGGGSRGMMGGGRKKKSSIYSLRT